MTVGQIQDREIEVPLFIQITKHAASVGFSPTDVDGIQPLRRLVPRAFDLYANERAVAIHGQIVGQAITYRPKDPKPPFQELRHSGRFRDVGFELSVQNEPDELPGCSTPQ